MKIIKGEYIEEKNKAGRPKTCYIVYGAANSRQAISWVRQIRKVKEQLGAWKGYADKLGNVYLDPVHGCTEVFIVERRG